MGRSTATGSPTASSTRRSPAAVPAVTTTSWSGATMPRVWARCSAMARRSAGMPSAGGAIGAGIWWLAYRQAARQARIGNASPQSWPGVKSTVHGGVRRRRARTALDRLRCRRG